MTTVARNTDTVTLTDAAKVENWRKEQDVLQPVREVFFKMVQPADDWKGPIDVVVPDTALTREGIKDAVIHFTGTVPEYFPAGAGKMRVCALGYRAGPCA